MYLSKLKGGSAGGMLLPGMHGAALASAFYQPCAGEKGRLPVKPAIGFWGGLRQQCGRQLVIGVTMKCIEKSNPVILSAGFLPSPLIALLGKHPLCHLEQK